MKLAIVALPVLQLTGALFHQALRFAGHVRRERLAEVNDLEFRQVGEMSERKCGAEGIFLFPQMSDHRQTKTARRRFTGGVDFG